MAPKPKLRRRLLACLTILSLLLCGATVGLWVRSYWRFDRVAYISGRTGRILFVGISSDQSDMAVVVARETFPVLQPDVGLHYRTSRPLEDLGYPTRPTVFGFTYYSEDRPPATFSRGIFFPHWFLALLFAILPAIRLRSILRARRRHRAGLCATCGYDLRATPDRCPECGTEVRT